MAASAPSPLEQRLTGLADRTEIADLLTTYARLLEERRIDDYAALFAPDGVPL